ncbi:MAG: hypothetical protein KF863_21475 [Rubrivivax sp.]|nr:hypothetical protein [Rubrivivax sp.]
MSEFTDAFEDAFNLLCGDRIGHGMSRVVFACRLLPSCVVKVEPSLESWQNVMEWQTWQAVKGTKASRWFAECRWISCDGRILVQERTRPPARSEFVDRVPIWFTDLKRSNWGMASSSGKREWLVCHDYGTALVLQEGTSTTRTKKADWWDAGQ